MWTRERDVETSHSFSLSLLPQIMDEGQAMWSQKKQEETDLNSREREEVRA